MTAIIVHGGCGSWAVTDNVREEIVRGCQAAVSAGYQVLKKGGSAFNAVEAAVNSLEDNPLFNAGRGSALNAAGEVEMDALIVDGKTLNFGGVACVKNIANPISLAKLVMERTEHVWLVGTGANRFAAEMGVAEVDPRELVTEAAQKEYEAYCKYQSVTKANFSSGMVSAGEGGHDTVGAVAIDIHGNLAAGTSTGGITLKCPGRMGDSPIIGCGAACDNTIAGVSATGHGESIARVTLAQRILFNLTRGNSTAKDAAEEALEFMRSKVEGHGGVVGVTKSGKLFKAFTTKYMPWASVDRDGKLSSGI